MKTIDRFNGDHEFLSNFYMHPVEYEGITYPSTEHAFQAAKDLNIKVRKRLKQEPTCGKAKRAGGPRGYVTLRKDWEFIKIDVMRIVLRDKFRDPMLRQLLIDTGDSRLVEGNTWGDRVWGVCKGKGKNWLGVLLMEIRREINNANNQFELGI